mgnify:CR=1 FL=1
MTTINSDQAEHIITMILENIAANDKIRLKILSDIDLDEVMFTKFIENVSISCDDVYLDWSIVLKASSPIRL